MESVLSLVEGLNSHAQEIFDRLDAACGQMDTRLSGLETRLSQATERIERTRGSTAALKVQSARTFQGRGAPSLRAAHRVLDESLLVSLRSTAPIPEDQGQGPGRTVSSTAVAEDLARVYKCVNQHRNLELQVPRTRTGSERLLPAAGRLTSVSELFLLNSSEQPYKVRHEVDNLAEPEDEAFYHGKRTEMPKQAVEPDVDVDLEEDEPLREHEDLRFRPRPAAEVTFDLPDVLPDLGHVAHLVWREGEQHSETARPAWDAPPPELGRASISAAPKPARPAPPAPKRAAPAAPKATRAAEPLLAPSSGPAMKATLTQTQAAAPAPAVPTPQPTQPMPAAQPSKPSTPAPPPPKPAAKGKGPKGKGKGKGPAPPPPPAKKAAAATKAPAPTKEAAVGKAAMFADIRSGGPKLRKVAPPKERSGAAVGRVV